MTRLLIILLLAFILVSCQSISGSGNIVTEVRNHNEFKGIKNSGSIDVEVMQSENKEIKVEADDNIIEYVITKIDDGILRIHLKDNLSYRNITVRVYVNTPVIENLSVSGSGTLISKNVIKDEERIELKVSGSGDMNVNVEAPLIVAHLSGSGKINMQGRTKDFSSNISGSGDLVGNNLLAENTTIKVSGSGTAYVFASVKMDAKVTGSGSIFYSGNPSSTQTKKSGSGLIEARK